MDFPSTMHSQRRQLDQQYYADDAVNGDDALQQDDAVQQTDDAVQQQDDAVDDNYSSAYDDDAVSTASSIRATNCISFTVEPQDEQFNAILDETAAASIPTSFVPEESFIFYSHRGYENGNANYVNNEDYDGVNFGSTYLINVKEFVAAFGGVTCESLAGYQEDIFSSYQDAVYWGPICHHTSFGITMGVFLDQDCTVYAPELSKELQYYLYYNEDGNPDEDLLETNYETSALNDYYQNELNCNGNDGDDDGGDGNSEVCSSILQYSVDEESCKPVDGSSSSNNPFTVSDWYQTGNPHRYYHLSQTDMQDLSSTCSAVNSAINGRYTFEDFLNTLEQENGDTAATLEHYNQDILSPAEKFMAIIGLVVLILIGLYCCVVTTRRLKRAHLRSKRQQQRGSGARLGGDDNDSIIYELSRTFTAASSSDESSNGGGSKKEPLIPSGGESTDITNGSTKYPNTASSYTIQPRLERDGRIVPKAQNRMQVIAVVPKEQAKASSKRRSTTNPFLRWMRFGGGSSTNGGDDVFDGITIDPSQTFDDPFVGIDDNAKRGRADNDTLFEGVHIDHEPSI